MEIDFSLYPIYKKEGIMFFWKEIIEEGLRAIEKYADVDYSVILNSLLEGTLDLWIIFLNKECIGFMTTRFNYPTSQIKELFIYHLYIRQISNSDEVFKLGMEKLEEYAKSSGCYRMSFLTSRENGFSKKLKLYNWIPKYVEFIKEVK
ncbi:MAG: GNAT family N-acetyltransferase [bacterium]